MEKEYDPGSFAPAMGVFKKHLEEVSPETYHLLFDSQIAFHYLPDFTFDFSHDQQELFELLSKPPHADFLIQATAQTKYDLKLRFRDTATRLGERDAEMSQR